MSGDLLRSSHVKAPSSCPTRKSKFEMTSLPCTYVHLSSPTITTLWFEILLTRQHRQVTLRRMRTVHLRMNHSYIIRFGVVTTHFGLQISKELPTFLLVSIFLIANKRDRKDLFIFLNILEGARLFSLKSTSCHKIFVRQFVRGLSDKGVPKVEPLFLITSTNDSVTPNGGLESEKSGWFRIREVSLKSP